MIVVVIYMQGSLLGVISSVTPLVENSNIKVK